jgi:hypothetical protein
VLKGYDGHGGHVRKRVNPRCLVIFASRPHDDVCWRGLGSESATVGIFSIRSLFEETDNVVGNTAEIPLSVRGDGSKEALSCFLGKVWLLENAKSRVDVRQVERSTRMTGVEDGCKPDACLQRPYHDPVHLVVGDVTSVSEVYGVDDFIITVRLVAIQVFGLTSMAYKTLVSILGVAMSRPVLVLPE